MDFEDQEGEIELRPSYNDSVLNNSSNSIPKITMRSPVDAPESAAPLHKPRYKECQKNHAVAIGGHAVDGCGEFMAAGAEGTLESLRCASCNCHRNFHRKENETAAAFSINHRHPQPQLLLTHHPHGHFGYRSPSGYLHVAAPPQQRPPLPPSSSGGGGGSEIEDYYSNPSSSSGKKRFRTRFTPEQKEKLLSFAERLGWKLQKQDDDVVQHFCNEIGIKRHVLKVWMHNNKHTLGKKID